MNKAVYYGTISPEEKKEIFESTILFLIGKRYDISITNGKGRMEYIELKCPDLNMTLDLDLDSELTQSNLMCHVGNYSFMVNDFIQIIKQVKKAEDKTKETNSEKKR